MSNDAKTKENVASLISDINELNNIVTEERKKLMVCRSLLDRVRAQERYTSKHMLYI